MRDQGTETKICFGHSDSVWAGYENYVRSVIEEGSLGRVCEIGGGANPLLSLEYVERHSIDYTVLDISAQELSKIDPAYDSVLGDIAAPDFDHFGGYQLAFSKMLAEHVGDGKQFHSNVYKLLAPGGIAVHFFPTLWALPFVANRMLPERLAAWVLEIVAPRDRVRQAKFPAFYSWCRGPSRAQLGRFERLGYDVVEYRGLFGHGGYYARVPVVRDIHDRFSRWLVTHPIPLLTSFALVVLRKRPSTASPP